ncbi:MAG: CaiB/BaiF CoA transferase family protein [Pigmentiphaga sp.]
MKAMLEGALTGVKVLDLTQVLSGPFCTQFLADHGADVIKIEPPYADESNKVGAYPEQDELKLLTGYYQSVNRNKRGIILDLKREEAREVIRRLVVDADVLVENYRSGVMEKFGLGYEALADINPRLIYAAVRGFGDPRSGASPYVDWPAFDVIAQAMGGIMGITGSQADTPTKVGPGVGDLVPGLMCAFGIAAALYERTRSGLGQFIDVAMIDGIAALCERVIHQYSFTGKAPVPQGNGHPLLCPFGFFETTDGLIAIAAAHQHLWERLCKEIGRPELATDERLQSNNGRVQHRHLIDEAILEYTRPRTRSEIMATLGGVIPVGPVYTAPDIFDDEHFRRREMLVEIEQPGMQEPVVVAGVPVKLSRTPGGVRRRAPTFGEHTSAILQEAGYSANEIVQLRENGVCQ